MKTIDEFCISVCPVSFDLPSGAKCVAVVAVPDEYESESWQIWLCFEHDDGPKSPRTFRLYPSGKPIPIASTYLGSAADEIAIWHVYELLRETP